MARSNKDGVTINLGIFKSTFTKRELFLLCGVLLIALVLILAIINAAARFLQIFTSAVVA